MEKRILRHWRTILIGIAIYVSLPHSTFAVDPDPDPIVKKHLDSVGSPEARSAIKSRLVEGIAQYQLLVGGTGEASGKFSLLSADHKLRFVLEFPPNERRDARFLYDGEKVTVAQSFSSTSPSFTEFLQAEDLILKQGFLGGVLSASWTLLREQKGRDELVYEGLRKVRGKELHTLRYRS